MSTFHQQMLTLAADAVQNMPADTRNVSSLVVCIKAKSIEDLRRRLISFQQELLALCDADEEPELVYQIGMQLFPLSRQRDAEEAS